MAFSFAMYYQPAYQKRKGKCAVCNFGILAGDRIMIGSGFFHGHIVRNHNHYDCWFTEVTKRIKAWFFKNDYKKKEMRPELKTELNRLRSKRFYIEHKGGKKNEVVLKKVEEINERIAVLKGSDTNIK